MESWIKMGIRVANSFGKAHRPGERERKGGLEELNKAYVGRPNVWTRKFICSGLREPRLGRKMR
jgi:hypothetical protein